MSEDHSTAPAAGGKRGAAPSTTPTSRAGRSKPPLPPLRGSRPKPAKPYPDFPLFPHAAGVWAKKIRGKLCYFGPWADPDGALKKYLQQKDDLHAGRLPRPDAGALTVKDVVNSFLNGKQALLDAGELSPRTWADYKRVCDLLVA